MKPFIVLIVVSLIALFSLKLTKGAYNFALSARIGMSVMLLFTAIAHFKFAQGMTMMLPDFIPNKINVVHLKIAAAVGILIPGLRVVTAWMLIVFFVLILPANVYAAIHHVDIQSASYDGNGPTYLWFRVPLQVLYIASVFNSCIKL